MRGASSGCLPSALVPKADFVGLGEVVHLAAGGETPFLRRHQQVFDRYVELKGAGKSGLTQMLADADAAKARVGALLGAAPEDVGFAYNVSQACNMLVTAMTKSLPGNVVMQRWEYPSMMYPWSRMHDRGCELRILTNTRSLMDYDRLATLIDQQTAAVVVSHVSYLTGERVDLARLRTMVDRVGALLVVDASHSLGVIQADWSLADFVFCCSYKWLLGSHGVSIAYCNRRRLPDWLPDEVGWANVEWQDAAERGGSVVPVRDGRMFELGIIGLLPAMLLGSGLEYLDQHAAADVEQHVLRLSGDLIAGLQSLGIEVMTPLEPSARAGNVAFEVADQDAWRECLEAAGVLAWTSDNRVRLSTFIYNAGDDVGTALSAVEEALATLGQRDRTGGR